MKLFGICKMKSPSILIVDCDSPTRGNLLSALLTEQINVVGQMQSSLEVVEHCVEIRPDVVLLGVTMPKMAELAILDGIRMSSPSVSVVIVTGNATEDLVKSALAKGASGIIVKPFSIARVLEVVKKCTKSSSQKIETH